MDKEIMRDFAKTFLDVLRRHDDITVEDLMTIISSLAVTTLNYHLNVRSTRAVALKLFIRNVNLWYISKSIADREKGGTHHADVH